MSKRDDYFRCKVCGKLFEDSKCQRDPDDGRLICPNNCVERYVQEPYESPLFFNGEE